MTTTFESAKVGDRVWCMRHGWGEIIATDHPMGYPISVYFPDRGYETYTVGGVNDTEDITRSLFWDEVEIEAPQKPLPDLEVDAKVLVWNVPELKHRRHFSHFSHGCIYTFDAGATSFTMLHRESITAWENWEIVE